MTRRVMRSVKLQQAHQTTQQISILSILWSPPHHSQDTTSPLKHLVQRPAKTADQLEKEYIENVTALTDMDEEEWLEAIALLEMEHAQNALDQSEQRTLAIIDEYYESLREEQERREASRSAERKEERKRARSSPTRFIDGMRSAD